MNKFQEGLKKVAETMGPLPTLEEREVLAAEEPVLENLTLLREVQTSSGRVSVPARKRIVEMGTSTGRTRCSRGALRSNNPRSDR